MKIGIISDTHGKLHPPVLELTASCDVVLHAGDVDNSQTLDQLWMHLKPNALFIWYVEITTGDGRSASRKHNGFVRLVFPFSWCMTEKMFPGTWTVYRWLSSGTVISLPWKKSTEDSG